jgi:hypothetical protein
LKVKSWLAKKIQIQKSIQKMPSHLNKINDGGKLRINIIGSLLSPLSIAASLMN